ncbi:MAG: ATP-binding protein [bacterium]
MIHKRGYTEVKVIICSVLFGLFTCTADSVLRALFFYKKPLPEFLFTDVPKCEIYSRLLIVAAFLIFGILMSRAIGKSRRLEEMRKNMNDLLNAVSFIQCKFILDSDPHVTFDNLLKSLLSLTQSKYGFIGEVLYTSDHQPYLKSRAITNIAWDEQTRDFYEKNAPQGMEFHNLKTLFGSVMTTGQAVISNDPATDPRRGGLPKGHPPLHAFLGIPLSIGERLVGMVGIANRPGGYDQELIEFLRPFLTSCANIIEAYRIDQRRKAAEEEQQRLQSQLNQSQKMESIGQLAGGTAHDFNNLLTSILGYSDLVLNDLPEDHPLREYLGIIKGSAEKAAELTRDLLAFSRKQMLDMKVISLNTIVEQMGKMLQRVITENIVLDLKTSPIMNVMADAGQIEQVLMNLVINARDAMPGGGCLTIETADVRLDRNYAQRHESVQPGPYVMLAVTDTGEGMSPEVQEKIFDPFFTTKEKGRGTGLGLSMVYGIVKQHTGYIWVYSEAGKGTTFKIYLPAVQKAVEAKEQGRDKLGEMLTGTETIMVVDDEPSILRLIVDVLQPLGYQLIGASSGEEALKADETFEGSVDLLLTDVIMTGMHGKELADALQARHPSMKVIFMSGYADNAIVHQGILDPEIAFLQKPLTPDILAHKVRNVLDQKA